MLGCWNEFGWCLGTTWVNYIWMALTDWIRDRIWNENIKDKMSFEINLEQVEHAAGVSVGTGLVHSL